jgi:acetyl esterase/lipase
MEFDVELLACLRGLPDSDPSDPVAMRRSQTELLRQATGGVLATDERVTFADRYVPRGPQAPEVKVRIYRPRSMSTPSPAFVYFHGGGFVAGSVELGHARALMLAAEVGCVVVSADYRLAPESPFPDGLNDCYSVLCWTAEHSDELGIDATRLGVGGESAGGALAAATALLSRDRLGPQIAFQLLLYPVLDDRMNTASMRDCTSAPVWDSNKCAVMWSHYLGGRPDTDAGRISEYAAPARASDLSGLPTAYISACEGDPLRDEAITYAQRLLGAGVQVELHVFPGTFHGFDLIGVKTVVGSQAIAEQLLALRRGLGTTAASSQTRN